MPKAAPANGRRPPPPQGQGRSQAMAPSSRPASAAGLAVRLRILDGPGAGTEYAIAGSVVRLGRGEDNDIVLEDNNASRLHAEVVQSRGKFVVRDLGSRNGIYVNRKKVSQQQTLSNGDRITIGGTSLQFITDGGAAAAGRPAPSSGDGAGLKRAVIVGGSVAVVLILLIAIAGAGKNGSGGGSRNPPIPDGNGGPGAAGGNDGVSLGSLLSGGNGGKGAGGNGIGVDRNSNTRINGGPSVTASPAKVNEAQIQTLMSQGDMAYSSGKFPDARAFYSRAAMLDPSCERCKSKQLDIESKIKAEIDHALQSGIDYFQTERYEDAKRQFEKVKMLDPDPKSLNNGNATNYITQIDKKLQEQR